MPARASPCPRPRPRALAPARAGAPVHAPAPARPCTCYPARNFLARSARALDRERYTHWYAHRVPHIHPSGLTFISNLRDLLGAPRCLKVPPAGPHARSPCLLDPSLHARAHSSHCLPTLPERALTPVAGTTRAFTACPTRSCTPARSLALDSSPHALPCPSPRALAPVRPARAISCPRCRSPPSARLYPARPRAR